MSKERRLKINFKDFEITYHTDDQDYILSCFMKYDKEEVIDSGIDFVFNEKDEKASWTNFTTEQQREMKRICDAKADQIFSETTYEPPEVNWNFEG